MHMCGFKYVFLFISEQVKRKAYTYGYQSLPMCLLQRQYTNAPSNELQGLLSVLTSLLTLQDPLQLKRLQCVIDGYLDDTDTQYDGMLGRFYVCLCVCVVYF